MIQPGFIISMIKSVSSKLAKRGIYLTLKGGSVVTQYSNKLNVQDIDVQVLVDGGRLGNRPGFGVWGDRGLLWGRLLKKYMRDILSVCVYFVRVLNKTKTGSYVLRARNIGKLKNITVLSIDRMESKETVLDIVLGDINNVHTYDSLKGNVKRVRGLFMYSYDWLMEDIKKMIYTYNITAEKKKEKRIKRLADAESRSESQRKRNHLKLAKLSLKYDKFFKRRRYRRLPYDKIKNSISKLSDKTSTGILKKMLSPSRYIEK